MRRRVQGEEARCAVPWKGATRRLTSRGRLGHAKARGRESPVPRAPASNLAIRHRPRSGRRPPRRSRVSARRAGQTNIRTFRPPPRARAGRQASPHRPQASHQARAGPKDPPLSGRPQGFKGPRTLQAPPRGSGETRERLAPLKLPRELRRPGSDRRSRAGRERRSSPKGTEARRPADPPNRRREPGQNRNPPPPPDRDPREGIAAPGALLRVGEPAGPKPDGPTALAGTPALSRGK